MLLLMVLLMRSLIAEHMLYILTIPDMMYLNACLVDVTYHMDGYDRNAVVGDVSQQWPYVSCLKANRLPLDCPGV